MKHISKMTQAEVAAYVQSHLRKHNIIVTLSGGAAVSIYTVNRYISADIDLVEDAYADRNTIKTAMEEIGFREKNRYFTHPDTQHPDFAWIVSRTTDTRHRSTHYRAPVGSLQNGQLDAGGKGRADFLPAAAALGIATHHLA